MQDMDAEARREAYAADVTYVTNSELGFDYLRDNLATAPNDLVLQRAFSYCIIDEVDSILIDEARTPLIISGQVRVLAGAACALPLMCLWPPAVQVWCDTCSLAFERSRSAAVLQVFMDLQACSPHELVSTATCAARGLPCHA